MLIQQGDVLIQTAKIPASAKIKAPSKRGIILAEGEATGHAHVITDTDNAVLFEDDNTVYLRVLKDLHLNHEEHAVITIPRGDYQVKKVQEYDHFAEEARSVKD